MTEEFEASLYVGPFLEEAKERLEDFVKALLILEKTPNDEEAVHGMFRAAHTLKGMAAMMGLESLENLSHAMEDVLEEIRSHKRPLSQNLVDILLEGHDFWQEALKDIEEGGLDKVGDSRTLIEKIRAAEGGGATQKGALESSFLQERIRSVRVRTEKLDSLLDLAGEILIVKNSLKGQVARKELSKIEESVLLLERLSEMLTEEVLGVRLVPLESLFEGIPRLVRNLSRELGKEVILQIQGAEVELDRVTLEGLREPLLHIIRNALDHGIESPEERVAAGKTKEGHLRLEAKREESWIVLCVCDDGRGVDPEKVLKKAKERGMIDEASLENLSEEEIFDFLFQPGFSTKERASEISGRGVGLDVVKEAVSKLGGRLDFRSVKNQGLEMILRLPQSTAIIRAMIVYNDGGIYAIPLNDVSEVLKLDSASIHGFRGTRMFSYRDAVIPLISLKELLEKRDFSTEKAKRLYCFVMSRGDRSAAIAVDDIGDIQDLVIKPAEGVLAKADGISGSSVLGDARVALVLDLPSLLTKRGAWKMAQEIKDQ